MKHSRMSLQDFERMASSRGLYDEYKKTPENSKQRERMKNLLLISIEHFLTGRQRYCLESYYISRKTVAEIAKGLEISSSAVYKHIENGMKTLKKFAVYI